VNIHKRVNNLVRNAEAAGERYVGSETAGQRRFALFGRILGLLFRLGPTPLPIPT
jgi:hypothetical protein